MTTDEPICRAGIETQDREHVGNRCVDAAWTGEGRRDWESSRKHAHYLCKGDGGGCRVAGSSGRPDSLGVGEGEAQEGGHVCVLVADVGCCVAEVKTVL